MTLDKYLNIATNSKWALGHFNASESDHFRAIISASFDLKTPAFVGTSEGERKHLGLTEAVLLREAFKKEYGVPVFLNADHSKSVDTAKAAVDAGYDSVHIDLSAASYEKNLAGTKEVVAYARSKNTEISVEGELGYLPGDSKIEKEKIEVKPSYYTDPPQAVEFVKETGINRLAIAVGNIHGISKNEPSLDIERIRKIRELVPDEVSIVLHAGSGVPDEQIRQTIEAGVACIHINTELRVAFTSALRKTLAENLDEVAMYKLDSASEETMKKVVKEKILLFGSNNKI